MNIEEKREMNLTLLPLWSIHCIEHPQR